MSDSRTNDETAPPLSAQLVQSPWFFAACFCVFGLLMLVVMRPKYNRRQAELERRFQAREFVSERRAQEETQQAERADKAALGDAHDETDELTEPPPVRYSTPKNKLIELSPLAIVLGVGLVVSLVGLVRQLHSSVEETTSTEEADRQTGVSPGEST